MKDINDLRIYNPGEIIFNKNSHEYLDQIDGKTLIHSNNMSSYLYKTYGITPQEYYNLVMYGGINNTPLCYKCGNPREFIKMSHGYKVRCKSCVDKCHRNEPKQFIQGSKPDKESKASKKRVENGTHNFINQPPELRVMAQLSSARNTFISRSEMRGINRSYFYIGLTHDNNIKIGVTFVGLARRMKALKLKSIHLILIDTPIKVANLEYNLKMKFINKLVRNNEVFQFSELNNIISFIKSNK